MTTERRDLVKMIAATAGTAVLAPIAATSVSAATEPAKTPEVPWHYPKLDPVAVAERAYPAYYKGGCCYASFEGIVGELRKEAGHPYTTMPTEMMIFGEGGVAGVSSLCGALNGAAAAIFLAAGGLDPKKKAEAFAVIRELFAWYDQEALPNYRPVNAKYEIKSSVSRSPLCHASVTNWCKAAGFKSFSPQRADRCGWLAASTAKHAAELLNKNADSEFKAAHRLPVATQSCRKCHDQGGKLEDSRGLMECGGCHFTGKVAQHP